MKKKTKKADTTLTIEHHECDFCPNDCYDVVDEVDGITVYLCQDCIDRIMSETDEDEDEAVAEENSVETTNHKLKVWINPEKM